MSTDSYLVIGGCGFLGSHIVDLLLERGERSVSVFDLIIRDADIERWGAGKVTVFSGDLTNAASVSKAVRESGATCIIQTASAIQGMVSRDVMVRVNVHGMRNVIDAALEHGVKKLVYTSTASVVYDGTDQNGIDETLAYPEQAFDDYNGTKAIAEQAVLQANGQGVLKTTSLRVAGLFGTRDRVTATGFLKILAEGRHTTQLGSNKAKYDWTFITNAARAHLLAADRLDPTHPKHASVAGEAFFITNGEPWGFWDLPRALWTGALQKSRGTDSGSLPEPKVIPYTMAYLIGVIMEVMAWLTGKPAMLTRFRVAICTTARWCNIDKARGALDYHPEKEVNMTEAVRRTVEWWLEEHPEFKEQVKGVKLV